jgi:hypothetical protein
MSNRKKPGAWKPAFLKSLAQTGLVSVAAQQANVTVRTVQRARELKNREGANLLEAQNFANAWDAALEIFSASVELEIQRRALLGIKRETPSSTKANKSEPASSRSIATASSCSSPKPSTPNASAPIPIPPSNSASPTFHPKPASSMKPANAPNNAGQNSSPKSSKSSTASPPPRQTTTPAISPTPNRIPSFQGHYVKNNPLTHDITRDVSPDIRHDKGNEIPLRLPFTAFYFSHVFNLRHCEERPSRRSNLNLSIPNVTQNYESFPTP